MIAEMTYYQLLWYFCFYSFLGWIVEVAYHAVTCGKVINRGFLNGPVCPVYGFSVLAVLISVRLTAHGMSESPGALPLFVHGMLLATTVELFTGWLLDLLFHAQWWDYSDQPFNFHGFICLKFSILWGLSVVFIVRIIHPAVSQYLHTLFPEKTGVFLLSVLCSVYVLDCITTILAIRNLSSELRRLEGFRKALRTVSDDMSTAIGESTLRTLQKLEEQQVQTALASAELRNAAENFRNAAEKNHAATLQRLSLQRALFEKQLNDLRKKLSASRHWGSGRMLRAFPQLQFRHHQELFDELRKH